MKIFIAILMVTILCLGCGRMGTVKHTAFFNSHDAKAHLDSIAKAKGYEVGCGGSGHSIGGPTGEKTFEISIKGNQAIRDTLMKNYKDYVESGLKKAGVTINGRGTWGEISGFDFNYHKTGLTGIVRVNSVVDLNGYIQVDIFIYEHK